LSISIFDSFFVSQEGPMMLGHPGIEMSYLHDVIYFNHVRDSR
jgi:hypothetical protein